MNTDIQFKMMSLMSDWKYIFKGIFSLCFFLNDSYRFNFEDETPTTNFDTFPAAILTVFQVDPPLPQTLAC